LGIERLHSFLRSRRRVALDTSVFIYQLEANARYFALSDLVFAWLEQRGNTAFTSTLSMTELLVAAYRAGSRPQIQRYFGLLNTLPNLNWVVPDLNVADIAARMRADYRLKTPDAIQAASAVYAEVPAFITNDPVFKRVSELDCMVLEDLL
jgi:predicted nucleic acid-binding protein